MWWSCFCRMLHIDAFFPLNFLIDPYW
jgi:hypothetical protein